MESLYLLVFAGAIVYYIREGKKKKQSNQRRYKPPQQPYSRNIEKTPEAVQSAEELNKKKGNDFENYIVSLFDRKWYQLTDWRSDKVASNGMYTQKSMHPDLEIRFKGTNQTFDFAIECKYRQSFYNGAIEWAEYRQINNYLEFERTTGKKVYVAIGIGGTPQHPEELYFMELKDVMKYPRVFESHLRQFRRNPNKPFFYDQQRGIIV